MENTNNYKINRYVFLVIIIIFAIFLFASLKQFVSAFLGAMMFYVLSKPFIIWLVGHSDRPRPAPSRFQPRAMPVVPQRLGPTVAYSRM